MGSKIIMSQRLNNSTADWLKSKAASRSPDAFQLKNKPISDEGSIAADISFLSQNSSQNSKNSGKRSRKFLSEKPIEEKLEIKLTNQKPEKAPKIIKKEKQDKKQIPVKIEEKPKIEQDISPE